MQSLSSTPVLFCPSACPCVTFSLSLSPPVFSGQSLGGQYIGSSITMVTGDLRLSWELVWTTELSSSFSPLRSLSLSPSQSFLLASFFSQTLRFWFLLTHISFFLSFLSSPSRCLLSHLWVVAFSTSLSFIHSGWSSPLHSGRHGVTLRFARHWWIFKHKLQITNFSFLSLMWKRAASALSYIKRKHNREKKGSKELNRKNNNEEKVKRRN